jgi:type IV fimbrial biogenesis protein FimT
LLVLGIPALALPPRPRERGFSIIEAVIAIALIALLLAMGLPSLGLFLDNQKIRASAETLYSGLQHARSSAVKQNTPVEFVMFDDPIDLNDFTFINSVTPKAGGLNWAVRTPNPAAPGTYTLVTTRAGAESSGSGTASVVSVTGGAPIITFNGFGGTNGLAGPVTFQFTRANPVNPDLLCYVPGGGGGAMRCLNVTVTTGGQIKVCDPAVNPALDPSISPNDPRRC